MSEIRSLYDCLPRPPTWAERERFEALRASGVEDVFRQPEEAPIEFWETIAQATDHFLSLQVITGYDYWVVWAREIRWSRGWPEFSGNPSNAYDMIIRFAKAPLVNWGILDITTGIRLSAVEHLLDIIGPTEDLEELINDRARWFRVGLRVEEKRFIPLTSEHIHKEVIQPTLVLLSDPRLEKVDKLYRKGFERALSNDAPGAVTAATSAVEEMLRTGLEVNGLRLKPLADKARKAEWIIPAVEQIIEKLDALRPESDARAAGTADFDRAMLTLHLTGSILLYLGRSGPFAKGPE